VPFLRVIRDKRGYETTYLMHWQREGNRQHSRILYVFRTPGGVRVGREALEADVLKEIEAQHPEIEFDWSAVFHNRQIVETETEPRRPRKRPPAETPAEASPAQQQQPSRPSIPSAIEGATPDEQIAFLNQWYALIRERIPQRIADPVRQQVLLALVERLNAAAWTDADQITAGLQQAAEALERLSHVFAKRRRRPKKRGSVGAAQQPVDVLSPADAGVDASTQPEGEVGAGLDEAEAEGEARLDEAEGEVGSDSTDDPSDSVPDE
jgi:hypothetical protein